MPLHFPPAVSRQTNRAATPIGITSNLMPRSLRTIEYAAAPQERAVEREFDYGRRCAGTAGRRRTLSRHRM